MIPHPLQAPRSTPSCLERRLTFTGNATAFVFFTLLSLSCSSNSLSIDFLRERSLLPSVLVFEVSSRDLILELEPSLCGDSLKVPRFRRSDSNKVSDLSKEGDLELSFDSDFSLVSIEVIVSFFFVKVV
jgi:hypothetical protein